MASPLKIGWRSTDDYTPLETIEVPTVDKVCILCSRGTIDELDEVHLGPLYSRNYITVHYYCLLFVSKLPQNGEDNEGILGFRTADIEKAVKRVNSRSKRVSQFFTCHYCRKPGASIGCCVKACKLVYHFPCGLENSANYQFTGQFPSFCETHAKLPMVRRIPSRVVDCGICNLPLGNKQLIFGSCCDSSIFHKDCVQKFALTAGRYFNCPDLECANREVFKRDAELQGIYVPEREAQWETEPDAYQGHVEQHSTCDAEICRNPKGRKESVNNKKSLWYLRRCYYCVGVATHVGCSPVPLTFYEKWICTSCSEVEARVIESRTKTNSKANATAASPESPAPSGNEQEENEEIASHVSLDDSSIFELLPNTPPPGSPVASGTSTIAVPTIPKFCDASSQTDYVWVRDPMMSTAAPLPEKNKKRKKSTIVRKDEDANSTLSSASSLFVKIKRKKKKSDKVVSKSEATPSTSKSSAVDDPKPSTSRALQEPVRKRSRSKPPSSKQSVRRSLNPQFFEL